MNLSVSSFLSQMASFVLARRAAANSRSLLESLLAGLAAVALLALLGTLLLGFLAMGGMYMGYVALVAHGYMPEQAALIIGGACGVALLVIVLTIAHQLRKLKAIPKKLVVNEVPGVNFVSNIVAAFCEGYRKPCSVKRKQ